MMVDVDMGRSPADLSMHDTESLVLYRVVRSLKDLRERKHGEVQAIATDNRRGVPKKRATEKAMRFKSIRGWRRRTAY